MRCQDCDCTVYECACPVSCDRFAPEAFLETTNTARETEVIALVEAAVRTGATSVAASPGEARSSIEWHARLMELAGDTASAARIRAIRCVGRVSAERRAA